MSSIRSTREIKRGLLKSAFAENRGSEMIREINDRVQRSQILPEHRELLDQFQAANENQPQAVRALNVVAERDGSATRYSDTILLPEPGEAVH